MLARIKARLGVLWWYAILTFIAQRLGDAINLFVGLWLVPRYVPMQELGAVMPITAAVGFLALPITIIVTPFQKFVALFNEAGEQGKVKALMRDVFIGTVVLGVGMFLLSSLVLPFFFARMRVAVGSLGILMLAVSITGAVNGVFGAAVGGVKRFGSGVWYALLGAPARLIVMLVALPFRALSGYVLGQGAPNVVFLLGPLWTLRDYFRRDVKSTPYWREHGRAILLYALPFALWTVTTTISGSVDALVIRHRLTDFESAGYYVITRFSEIAGYLGVVFPAMLFPLVASANGESAQSRRLLWHSVGGTAVCGIVCVVLLMFGGKSLLGLLSVWSPYQSLSPHMAAFAANTVLSVVTTCFLTYEMAQGKFRFLWYAIPILAAKCLILYSVTGYTFFRGYVPESWMAALAEFNPCRLSVVVGILLTAQLLLLIGLLRPTAATSRINRGR